MYKITAIFVFLFFVGGLHQKVNAQTLKGYITERDTVSTLPFVYIVNKTTGVGCVSSDKGYFELRAAAPDTILISCIGYVAIKMAVKDIVQLPSYINKKSIVLFSKTYTLKPVMISPNELSQNQKNYYERFINMPKPALTSPVSALYYEYSKEGKERKKLIEIYKKELFFERAENRLAYFLSTKKVDLSKFDKRAFIMYCKMSEELIEYANDYEFYYKVSRCFDEYTGNPDYR